MSSAGLQYRMESLGFRAFLALAGAAPVDRASAIGGALFQALGPCLGASNRARSSLARAFPDWSEDRIENVVRAMWDNLGRTAVEYAHLDAFAPYRPESRVEVAGGEVVARIAASDRPALFFSGHFANWEVMTMAVRWHPALIDRPDKVAQVYRAMNNPLVDAVLVDLRRRYFTPNPLPKGAQGARGMIDVLKRRGIVCLLIDQKLNDGIKLKFFGREAMTTPAVGQLALKYDAAIVPVSNVRLDGARFRVTFHEPMSFPRGGDKHAAILAIGQACNDFIERQVREHPAQWFWVHRRWMEN